MRKIACILCCALCAGCATLQIGQLSVSRCERELSSAAVDVNAGKISCKKLERMTVGESGFFYILSSRGILSCHPVGELAGSDFSTVPAVKQILLKDKGMQSDDIGGVARTVFFQKLDGGMFLCLSVDSGEIKDLP
ncbi:MAG: hypothetical protein ACRCUT_00095 [Spirochaetota bacterium]